MSKLKSRELIQILDANPALRDIEFDQIPVCPEVLNHPVMQQLETLTLISVSDIVAVQDVALFTDYISASQLSGFKFINHHPEITKAALQAAKMVSMQLWSPPHSVNPFADSVVCRASHIISLSLDIYDNDDTYQYIYDAITNLPHLQRFESSADIEIYNLAFAQAFVQAEKLVFFCTPYISFTDRVLRAIMPRMDKIVAWSCHLQKQNADRTLREFFLSMKSLLYYFCFKDHEIIMPYAAIINQKIAGNIIKIRFQAGLKHLAAITYGNHYRQMPEAVPVQVQELVKLYQREAVTFDDLWHWLWINDLV